jgi:hypothetical protein
MFSVTIVMGMPENFKAINIKKTIAKEKTTKMKKLQNYPPQC